MLEGRARVSEDPTYSYEASACYSPGLHNNSILNATANWLACMLQGAGAKRMQIDMSR